MGGGRVREDQDEHERAMSERDPKRGDGARAENVSDSDNTNETSKSKKASRLPGRRGFDRMAVSPTSGAGGAYQGAMEATLAVVVATGIGYWADSRFGTEPFWLIVGAVVGFAAMVVRLLRMAKLLDDPSIRNPDESARRTDGTGENADEYGNGTGDGK